MEFASKSIIAQLYEIAELFFDTAYNYIEPFFLEPWDMLPRLVDFVYDTGFYEVFPELSGFIAWANLKELSLGAFLILMFVGGWISLRLIIFLVRIVADIIDAVLP